MRNFLSFILISGYFRYVLQLSIFLLFTSCYTLNSHQTGKTLGKDQFSYQIIYGLAGVPSFNDENNWESGGIMLPQVLLIKGITSNLDLGASIGLNKTGFFTKYQFVGNSSSKAAMAVGINGFGGLNELGLFRHQGYYSFELPLYFSYDLSPAFTIYSSPSLSYIKGDEAAQWLVDNSPLLAYDFYKGAILGLRYNYSQRLYITLESAWHSPLINNTYNFYTTAGIGVKFSKLFSE